MTWVDHILDFFHLMWFGVKWLVRNIWASIRAPFWIYLVVITLFTGAAIATSGVVLHGVAVESTWTIFWGGIFLLVSIGLVGVVLIPAVLGINIVRDIYTRLFGGRP